MDKHDLAHNMTEFKTREPVKMLLALYINICDPQWNDHVHGMGFLWAFNSGKVKK